MTGRLAKGGEASEMPTIRTRWSFISRVRSSRRGSFGKSRTYPASSITTESGSRRRSQEPSSILRGAPASVESSRPIKNVAANLPVLVRATGLPLKSRTAQPTPETPRTRVRSVSFNALVWSQYSVWGSMTQTSASVTSSIWLAVRRRMLAKIEVWFSSRNVQKAIANTRPKYLARSPVSMRSATKFMSSSSVLMR
jgi:hypothetical protein